MANEIGTLQSPAASSHAATERLTRAARWVIMSWLIVALIYAQVPPRFFIFNYAHYGWPCVSVVRHMDVRYDAPVDIRWVVFVPGLIANLLAWPILIGCVALVLRLGSRNHRELLQVRVSSLLWLITVAAIMLMVYRAQPRDFWMPNRILCLEPRAIQAVLTLGLSCVVYVAVRSTTHLCSQALALCVTAGVRDGQRSRTAA
ncbi:MAG: hypothetical protein HY000_26730 [Planctomycetes bacterium]|nr:hypothetical protein [Planctomycetota bacterium]